MANHDALDVNIRARRRNVMYNNISRGAVGGAELGVKFYVCLPDAVVDGPELKISFRLLANDQQLMR